VPPVLWVSQFPYVVSLLHMNIDIQVHRSVRGGTEKMVRFVPQIQIAACSVTDSETFEIMWLFHLPDFQVSLHAAVVDMQESTRTADVGRFYAFPSLFNVSGEFVGELIIGVTPKPFVEAVAFRRRERVDLITALVFGVPSGIVTLRI